MTTTTKPHRGAASAKPHLLTGDSLIAYVNDYDLTRNTRTDMIIDAGYVYDNGKAMYTEFYTNLLRAKGVAPVLDSDIEDNAYDDLDDDTKALYDKVDDMFGKKWSHEEVLEFIEELKGIDIYTASEFNDHFYGRFTERREFAQDYADCLDLMSDDNSLFYYVDWDRFADELEYDFDVVEFDYELFYFTK